MNSQSKSLIDHLCCAFACTAQMRGGKSDEMAGLQASYEFGVWVVQRACTSGVWGLRCACQGFVVQNISLRGPKNNDILQQKIAAVGFTSPLIHKGASIFFCPYETDC